MDEPAPPQPNCVPEPVQPLSVWLPVLSTPVRVSTRVRVEEQNSNSTKPQTNKAEQTVLCHVTAFVVRLTRRTVLLQTSVAALFPLTGTIQGTGRDAAPCLRATDRWMRERQKKHTDGRPCHLQARCLSGFLMAKVTDVADEQPHTHVTWTSRKDEHGGGGAFPQKQHRVAFVMHGISEI